MEIREAYENDFTPLYEKEIYLSLSRQIEETVTAGNRDGVLELLKLYIQYNDSKNPEDNKYRDILDKYINDNKDQIEEYMKLNYPEKERIFYIKSSSAEVIETKKRLKLKTIRELIDGHEFSDESENRIKNLKENVIESYTLEMLEDREKNKKNLEEIHKMLGKKPLSKADEKILIELVLATNVNAFSSTDLEDLKTLKVEEITTALEDKIIDTLKNQDLINSNEINVNLDLYEAVRKNILLWETKAEQAKGTIDYANIIKKRDSLYKSSNIYSQMLKKVKDENGNYTENGLNELKEYKESLIYADISAEIEYMDISQITEENIESYTQYLLVGASLNGKVYMDSLEMLRKLYPDLDKNNDGNFVELVYARLFGEKYANNQELIEEKYKTLKENVFDRILKGQKTEKISDEKLESYINNNIEEMDISKIDFSKSELRNFFNDSKVKFTENDEMLYHGLYRKSLSNTLINNSHDAKLIRLLSLLSIEDAMKREDILLSNANGNQRIGSLISEMLEENPELKEEVFDENGEIREDTLNKGEEFKKDSLQANLLEKIKSAFEKEGMHPRIKLKIAILAYSYVHPPKEEIDNSINDLFDKLSSRLFETLNTQERMLIQFDEKGEPILNPNNICELYNELNSRNPMDSFEQICDVEKTKYETYGVYNFANRYVNLREDDEVNDYEDLEKIENIEERTLKLVELQKIRNKEAKEKLKAETPQRRFDLIESQVAVLSESEVKKLKNKDLIAVWYNCQIKKEAQYSNGKARSKEFEKLYESDLTEVISSLREKLNQGDSLRIEKIYDVKQIQNAIQDEKSSDDVFKKLIEENKTRKVNRKDNLKKGLKLDIKHLNKKDIDENYNEIINSFWYESKIEELRMLKAFEDADNLELEFKNKFNGKSLKDSIADTYETIDKTVDNNFFGVDGQNVDEMKIGILGENGYTYTNLLKNVDFKILKEQKNIGRGEIEKIIDSQDAYDVKITKLANMYKVFSCDKVNKAESQIGMQMIKLCIEFKKTEFNELLREDKKLDIDKLLTFTNTKKYNMLGMCDKITNKMKNAENKMQLQKDNVRSLYDYYYPKEINENETEQEKQENRDNIQEILEKALEDNLITPRAKKVLEAKEPEIYTGAVTSIEAIKNTTWRGLVKRSVDLSGKAILNLPKLLKKEGREEFSHKVSDHLENGMRIIPKKTKSTVKSLAKKGKINKKEKNGLLDIFKKKPKQIGPAQDVEKSDTMSEEQGDKAQNNQTEKKDYLNSPQFQGIDNGVYQKTQETQRSQENQPEQENSGGLKKSTILDGQEIE